MQNSATERRVFLLSVFMCACFLGAGSSASAKTLTPRSLTGWRIYRKAPVRLEFNRHRGRVSGDAKLTITPGRQKDRFMLRIIRGSGEATIPREYSPTDRGEVVTIKNVKHRERITVQQQSPTGRVKAVNYYFIPRSSRWRRFADYMMGR
jgi:hypothetical protein